MQHLAGESYIFFYPFSLVKCRNRGIGVLYCLILVMKNVRRVGVSGKGEGEGEGEIEMKVVVLILITIISKTMIIILDVNIKV